MAARSAPARPPAGPYGVWLIAGTPVDRPYPCRCWLGQPCGARCPCVGRTDAATMPVACCARRAHDTARRARDA